MNCYYCAASIDNGLALCELCQRKGHTIFEFLPVYFRNLARWRPGRAGSRPVPGSRVLYDGADHTTDHDTHHAAMSHANSLKAANPRATVIGPYQVTIHEEQQ